jgi:hypothetical protein
LVRNCLWNRNGLTMTIERKLLGTSPSGGATDVAEVFSTYLYKGNGSTQTITNGIDLAGEGGMVWIKERTRSGTTHDIYDTGRGAGNWITTTTGAASAQPSGKGLTAFTSSGFSLGQGHNGTENSSGQDIASFTFRKKSGFFDCLTYSGNSATDQTINHNLGSTPAFMLVKRTDATGAWNVYHTSMGNQKYAFLNSSEPVGGPYSNLNWAVTDTTFSADGYISANNDGATYAAYLFADNSSEDVDDQMIKCGSFTGTGSAGLEVNLGWEPQWVLIKNTSRTSEWMMQDTMRGMSHNWWRYLIPNDNSAESGSATNKVVPTATGFTVNNNGSNAFGQSGDTLVYVALRSLMMKEPEAATDVFHVNASQGNAGSPSFYSTGFDVDMAITKNYSAGASYYNGSRLAGSGQFLRPDNTNAEDNGGPFLFDVSDGVTKTGGGGNGNDPYVTHMWKRAKGYMDAVAYSGADLSGGVLYHSLGVKPELVIIKQRNAINSVNREWAVGSPDLLGVNGNTLSLNNNYANGTLGYNMFNTTVGQTDTQIKLHGNENGVSGSSGNYIAYLFATLDGISKVGSYTGTGSDINVDCGFSAGARFILIKRTDATGDWYLYDTARGIVAGADPFLKLNTNEAQDAGNDGIDPLSSGFIVTSSSGNNTSGGNYIFYAIA